MPSSEYRQLAKQVMRDIRQVDALKLGRSASVDQDTATLDRQIQQLESTIQMNLAQLSQLQGMEGA